MKIVRHTQKAYRLLISCVAPAFAYLKQGYRSKQMKAHCINFAKHLFQHARLFGATLDKEYKDLGSPNGLRMQKLHTLTLGLHTLLPHHPHFSYSIIIPVLRQTHPDRFRHALISALQQTAPHLEVIAVYGEEKLPESLAQVLNECQATFPGRLKIFNSTALMMHESVNAAVQQAVGHFILLEGPEDWLRPDYIFRCEQLLRFLKDRENVCIYTDEYEVNERSEPMPGRQIQKPQRLVFPYLFYNGIGKSVLIPRHLWNLAGGLQDVSQEEQIWDLALRLDATGTLFRHLPFYLYAKRSGLAKHQKDNALVSFVSQLNHYSDIKKLPWKWSEGLIPHTYRALPQLSAIPTVQVIIPFKEQKELTLKTIQSVLKQKGARIQITAVDNASCDSSIGENIKEMGGEVLLVEEPFNFSRLNNLAVEKTKMGQHCDYLLFLNNDVELEEGALLEMCRWIEQPLIGLVGSRLIYPNGLLQHGGIDLKRNAPANQMVWNHSEKMYPHSKQSLTQVVRLADAVTAACALMKRKIFVEIGGFDEIWYPVAYSDTNLAVKIEAMGLYCLYTPYAKGVHHESVSRSYENIEDFEMSHWLHQQYALYQLPAQKSVAEFAKE
ncbi:MAG: glycosyltransferase [Candidatus Protochlamydia sp.]|nr:glycosyltransferase [Candidatus Protochlamydia sp.]